MDEIRHYIISVVAAAVICGIITSLTGKKGTIGGIIKFLCGLFMTITAISPWVGLRFSDEFSFWENFRSEAQAAVREGEVTGAEMRSTIITDQLETYILEKADSLGLTVSVEISLDDNFIPELVIIQGAASPYTRNMLCSYIRNNLGISGDRLTWT